MKLRLVLLIAVFAAACNGDKKDTAQEHTNTTAAPPDRIRDGLEGDVKTYIHQEYSPAIQQGDTWTADTTQPVVRTIYRYNSAGNIAEIEELLSNGQPTGGKRMYRYDSTGRLKYILQIKGDAPLSRTQREWLNEHTYIERTLATTESDTSAWQHRTIVRLNDKWQLQDVEYQVSDTAKTYSTSAASAYNADGSLRSRTIYTDADSTVMTYTQLQKDEKGNPIRTLKQYSDKRPPVLIIAGYEYY